MRFYIVQHVKVMKMKKNDPNIYKIVQEIQRNLLILLDSVGNYFLLNHGYVQQNFYYTAKVYHFFSLKF